MSHNDASRRPLRAVPALAARHLLRAVFAMPSASMQPNRSARWARVGTEGLFAADGGPRVSGVRRIAVLRATPVGALVVALPALVALRRCYPRAHIALLGSAWQREFFHRRPSPIDEVVVVPASLLDRQRSGPWALHGDDERAFVAAMQARRFDVAVQLHGGGAQSNPLVRAIGARVSAGMQAPDAPPLERNLPYREWQHEALRLLETVALVGAHAHDVEPRLAVTEADRAQAAAVLPADGAPLLVLQPSCSDPRRAWPAERYAAVGDHFAARGARVVLNGTAAEAPLLAQVRAAMRAPALDLAGRLSLGGLLGLLARARLLISNDTGTAHLARAIGTPTVTVFWIGNVAGYLPMSSARDAVVVSWRTVCPRCGRSNVDVRCEHQDSFVDEVGLAQVLAPADELWHTPAPTADAHARGRAPLAAFGDAPVSS